MHKIIRSAMVAGATLALVFSGTAGATAFQQPSAPQTVSVAAAKKTAPVTISKIGNRTVEGSKKATIKPAYKTAKNVKVTSALLTVTNGSKTVAKNKKSASLAAGTYKVTTTVKYTLKGKSSSAKKTETVTVKKAAPAVTINKIGNKTVEGSKKATIKPTYKTAKKVKVTSALLTVTKGNKTVVKNKKSAALGAGTYKVTTTVKYTLNGKASSVKKTETIVVKKKATATKKTVVQMDGKTNQCPKGFPVKGNRTGSNKEWKYHVPGQRFYEKTKPEECFKTANDAKKAGYRASKV